MKLCKVSDIVGNERLAKPIMTSNYQELLAAGTVLKPEYVPRILNLGINEVYIEDGTVSPEDIVILRKEVEGLMIEKVRSVLERHIYSESSDLAELSKTAENIISHILENDEIMENVYDIRERSADIYEHSINVCALAIIVAVRLGISKEEIHHLGVAALFHDIGLRYLNFDYSNVSIESLDDKQIVDYKKHPAYAFSALEKENWISSKSKKLILAHHERKDGSGFPLHARNSEFTMEILQVCEAFDEMICGIGCQRARVYEAVEYLKAVKEVYFGEPVVNALLEFTAVYPAGTTVLLNTGESGIVIRQNKLFPERPILQLITDKNGNKLENGPMCDLLKVNNIYIDKVQL